MFWYTKVELIELYEEALGKNYYGDNYMECPVMVLRKRDSMLPYEFSKAGIQSGEMLTAKFNREEICINDSLGNLIVTSKLEATLGKEIINCLAFISKNPAKEFYTLLVCPSTLKVEASKLINQYKKSETIILTAEDIGLGGMDINAFLVKATIETKRELFSAFTKLSQLVEESDSRMVMILPNIEPAEYQFYYRQSS